MECLGFEPGTAGCKAQTENPLSYGGPHDRTFLAGKYFFFFLVAEKPKNSGFLVNSPNKRIRRFIITPPLFICLSLLNGNQEDKLSPPYFFLTRRIACNISLGTQVRSLRVSKREGRVVPTSVTRLGDFLNFLVTNFLTKVAQILW